MKQFYMSLLCAVIMYMSGAKAYAYDIAVENNDGVKIYYNYSTDGKELIVTFFSANYNYANNKRVYIGEIVIPEEVSYMGRTRKVTSISESAFRNCSDLTSITIPGSVTSIGDYAFYGCSGLTSVHISDIGAWCKMSFGAETAYSNPLYYAHHLYLNDEEIKDLVIPDDVVSINGRAFNYCSGLTSVTIPNSVTSIGDEAFYECGSLTSITIPGSVTSIGSSAFKGCSSLTSVTIPNSVTSIGEYAFKNCSGLTSVHISDIGAWCKISFGDALSNPLYYAHHLYLNGEEIKDLVIPSSVTSIGSSAFRDCSGLTSVTIPNSVTSIGNYAFYSHNITNVVSLITEPFWIGGSVFSPNTLYNATLKVPYGTMGKYKSTYGWKDFIWIEESEPTSDDPTEPEYDSEFIYNGIKYNVVSQTEQTVEVASNKQSAGSDGPISYSGDITIPSTVSNNGKAYTVVGIGESAFVNSSISSISLPSTLTYIGKEAFTTCIGLISITIPKNVTTYGNNAFWATLISEMTVMNPVPVEVPYNEFIYLQEYNNCVLYVPCGSGAAYRNAAEWKKFKKIIELGSEPDLLDGHEYADMGLPSGKCWATMNYGATSPDGYGLYLEWNDRNTISSEWGSGWTTPSLQDIRELENNCTWTWGSNNGHRGYTVKGKNGNSIFLPACGYKMIGQSSANNIDDWAYYWTSTNSGDMASIMMCTASSVWYGEMNTSFTMLPIRPITKDSHSNGIDDIQFVEDESHSPVYDLTGRRVTNRTKGHLYISNGKKYIAK